MNGHQIKRLNQGTLLHIIFKGEVHHTDITTAIQDCSQLLLEDSTIRHIIFDCTKSTRLKLCSDNIKTIARQSAMLTTIKKNLVMIGVMDRNLDYILFKMWKIFVEYDPLEVAENQIHVVRCLEQAINYLKALCSVDPQEFWHTQTSRLRIVEYSLL